MQRSLAVLSAWPGIQATQNLVSGNNTQRITGGWWKQERFIWQDSTSFTPNSQCWNNDGISQGSTRGSKGVLWFLKASCSTGSHHQFPLQRWVVTSPIYLVASFYDFIALNLFLLSAIASCRSVMEELCLQRSWVCSTLNISNNVNYNKLCETAVCNDKVITFLATIC